MAGQLLDEIKNMGRYRRLPAERLKQLADITAKLRSIGLFDSLTTEEVAYLAESARIVRYLAGDLVIRKGDTDKTFYVIVSGQVRVWDKQADGLPRLLNYHTDGDFFGELAPLNDTPRSANVDVVSDVELVAFEPDGFARVCEHGPILDYLRSWGRDRILASNREFDGKHWDEISIVLAHKSWFALARTIVVPMLFLLGILVALALLLVAEALASEILISLMLASMVGMGLWVFWMYEDWRNDDLIVTSKRIIHIERVLVPPFPLERHEASVDQVQDITTRNHGLWTTLFGVETLEIKTAGAGTIAFPYLIAADVIRDQVFRARDLARVRRVGEERSRIRNTLLTELERPGYQQVMPLESGEEPAAFREPRGLLKAIDYFIPRQRVVQPDRIVWRKHWLILVRDAWAPALLLVVSLGLLALAVTRPGLLRSLPLMVTVPVPAVVALGAWVWYLWVYDGWRNDIYIVTDERIIDIEGSPFHLRRESRTEGTFDVIQNTDFNSPNWLARILRIGDVTIDTASKQAAFTFNSVAHPDQVQQEIFRRLMAFREKRRYEESERQHAEFSKWFGTYHRSVMEQKER
ncbi:MAG: cyclic nucleotide-binding domain-containing protein [Anaerolineae bacterium]|nr:cyclic nucleotide-binding domain-containing protein [Anaerolineae bacterium]